MMPEPRTPGPAAPHPAVPDPATPPRPPTARARRERRFGLPRAARSRLRRAAQQTHLWATLIVGVFLLVVTTTGVAALFQRDVLVATHPALFRMTPGPPVGLDAARAAALAAYPGWQVTIAVTRHHAPYLIYAHPAGQDDLLYNVYVDPGTGRVNGALITGRTVIGWLTEVHYTLLADKVKFNYPAGTPWWVQASVGPALSDLLLKTVGLALMLLVLSGAYLWWPRPGTWKRAFARPRSRQTFVRDLGWHRLVGAASLPFLFMWALTGLNFYAPFQPAIKAVWYALTFTPTAAEAPDVHSEVRPGHAVITARQAEAVARRLHPEATFVSYAAPDGPDGVVNVYVADRYDATGQGEFPGDVNLQLDAYSGALLHDSSRDTPTWGARVYASWFYGLHSASFLPWPLRLIWAAFGLTPLFLAFTGMRMWWHRRRRAAQARSRADHVASAPPPSALPTPLAAGQDHLPR